MPESLIALYAKDNDLTSLQILPPSLQVLLIHGNPSIKLPHSYRATDSYIDGWRNVASVRRWQSGLPDLPDRNGDAPAIQAPALPQPTPAVPQNNSTTASDTPAQPSPALPQPTPDAPITAAEPAAIAPAPPLTTEETNAIRKFLGADIDLTALNAWNTWNASISNPNASLQELVSNADKLVSISGSKRLVALANADYDVPKKLIDYYRTFTQTLESVYINAQVAKYGLHQQTQSTSLKVMGAVSSSLPFPGTSVLSSLLVAGVQQNIEVTTTRELKKILACFGDSKDFLEVTNAVAKKVCTGKQKYLEAYSEDEALKERSHGAGYQGLEVASPFMLVNLFKKAIRSAGMAHERNLFDSLLGRKAIDDVGTLVDAMIGMSEAEVNIMLQGRAEWMAAKLGVVDEEQKPAAAVAGPSHREATAVPTEMEVRQMMRELAIQRQVINELQETKKLHAREIATLKQNLPPQDDAVIVPGRGGAGGNQAQMQAHRQVDPFASPEGARMQRRNAVLEDQVNQQALEIQALKERFAREDAKAARQS